MPLALLGSVLDRLHGTSSAGDAPQICSGQTTCYISSAINTPLIFQGRLRDTSWMPVGHIRSSRGWLHITPMLMALLFCTRYQQLLQCQWCYPNQVGTYYTSHLQCQWHHSDLVKTGCKTQLQCQWHFSSLIWADYTTPWSQCQWRFTDLFWTEYTAHLQWYWRPSELFWGD